MSDPVQGNPLLVALKAAYQGNHILEGGVQIFKRYIMIEIMTVTFLEMSSLSDYIQHCRLLEKKG